MALLKEPMAIMKIFPQIRSKAHCPILFLLGLLFIPTNNSYAQSINAPTDIADVQLWLDAGDPNGNGTTPPDGSTIDIWRDKSGLNNNATVLNGQGPASFRSLPALQINGRPVMEFASNNPTSGDIYNIANLDIRPNANPDISVFVVYRQRDISNTDNALWGIDNLNWDRFFYLRHSDFGDTVNDGIAGLGPGDRGAVIAGSAVANRTHLLSIVYDGEVSGGVNSGPNNASLVRFGSNIVTTFTDTTDPSDQQPSLNIGWDGDDGAGDFYLAEFIVYNRLLTTCETSQIVDYLSIKYGASFSRTITQQPATLAICSPDDAVFTVETTGNGLTYQWQEDVGNGIFSDIIDGGVYSGSGTDALTIVNPPVAYTGRNYRVLVTRPSGCISTSNIAGLTVGPTDMLVSTNTLQTFCDIDNGTIADLTIVGTDIKWYASDADGTPLPTSDVLATATYYATQTINGCESFPRLPVQVNIFETVTPPLPIDIPNLRQCDNLFIDGNDTNGSETFDLTQNETILLNGKSASDYSFGYFTEATYTDRIPTPNAFVNTVVGRQTIYVRISNNLDPVCHTDVTFDVEVMELPVVRSPIVFKNCDEDGVPDGFTDYNLNEANDLITNNNGNFTITYHSSFSDADTNNGTAISPVPYNNAMGNTVFARIENANGCHRVATINLEVSTTSFPIGYTQELADCDDDTIDGYRTFDLTQASNQFIAQFPTGQNLSVHYYRNLSDAQLEQNEIIDQTNYSNEVPFSQTLYIRVENDTGDCFGIGGHLILTVYPKPVFEVAPTAVYCIDGSPITLRTFNPEGTYTYEWTDENGTVIGNDPTVNITSAGVYTVIATSSFGCDSFPSIFNVVASGVAEINDTDISIKDFSENNTITIHTENNRLGPGDYEFALDSFFGPYQDEPFFNNVIAGTHTLYVRDKNGCGVSELEINVLGFPKFFTPNNDGYNDTWQAKGVNDNVSPSSSIRIFDRYGKLLVSLDPKGIGWNGTYNNARLPASDYWFVGRFIDQNGKVRIFKGHFSLIR
ncbi:T9SS type B sorting domain-containing protein [Maribacter sp. 2304DJ31-5]|uniref:T9SS type B sorting domain-containing protein n=1 Tax=Maribacter sp. 2304DJ31-5 TaxID=3386273 RepID=UPI0039BC4436